MENPDNSSKETLEKWHKDPNNWIWDMLYYNKEDKRIFPPKKIKWTGWTVNFANTKSILVFTSFIALTTIFVFLSKW